MPHMNFRTFTPIALIAAVLVVAAVAALATGVASPDLTPRTASGLVLRAL